MLPARREGTLLALLMLATAFVPRGAAAEEPKEPPAQDAPVDEAPPNDAPAEDTRADDAPAEQPPEDIVTEDVDGEEWITPDVAGAEEEEREDAAGDVDEVIINYGASPDTREDQVTDAEGKELEEIPVPVVSKAVEVQDPDKLEPGADKETGVQGQVVSRRPKKVLPDAPVLAKGEDDGKLRSTLTDERGRYRLYLPPGQYTLRSYYDLYHGARWDNIVVTRGAFKRVNFILDPISEEDAGVEEQEVAYVADTTSEAAQLNIRKEAITVQDSISAQEIKRAGDSTAGDAVARVVGVTIDDDDRLIIRGLAGRYNRVLLNGIPIPGVDPNFPSVKLDIFPTDIVSNLAVVKTPRPDLPGNFAGGLLLINTDSYPRDFMLKVGVSLGFNSMSTFRQMPDYAGSKTDFLGFDKGTRSLPGAVGDDRLRLSRGGRYATRDQTAQVGREFPNIWNAGRRTAVPKMGFKLGVGDTKELNAPGRRAGYLLSFVYEYEDQIKDGYNKRFVFDEDGNTVRPQQDFDFQKGVEEVLWGAFGSGLLEIDPDNFLNLTTFFSRASEVETLLQFGEDAVNEIPTTKTSFDFIGRSILFNQLKGDHYNLGDSRTSFHWNGMVSWGKRDQPDRRLIEQQVETQAIPKATRFYADLSQLSTGGQVKTRFPLWEAAYGTVGIDAGYEKRDFLVRRFEMRPFSGGVLAGDPEFVYGPDGLGTLSNILESTLSDDAYDASNTLYGGFLQLETPITKWLKFLGLMRFEVFRQQIQSRSPFAEEASEDEASEGTDRTDLDPMPSATLSFEINPEMFVKLGYGMTVIRPALRELAPFLYVDFLRGWNIRGNENLQRTQVQNVEARYEYYFGKTDLFAATAFYKYMKNPIEFVVLSPVNSTASYANASTGWLFGGEIELRLGFGRFHEKLEKFFFLGNVALAQSQTTLPENVSGRSKRPLFYQSKYVTNLSLRFDDPDSGVMVGLVYNAFGPRIVEVGVAASTFDNPDVIELQQHLLDLIASWRVHEHVKLGFKWTNIAFARKRYRQGDELVLLENRGTSVGISAEYIY
ncbi:MAG: outer membrane beta-barrel protein [Deltaproteobacteria bacterium]|nr:outer membrane beta-barrel protein [Deltaproteobacteria bacterium]